MVGSSAPSTTPSHGAMTCLLHRAAFEPVERPHADPVLISRGHLADFVVSAAKCGNRFRHPLDPLPDHIARGIERLAEHLDAGHGVAERAFDVAMQPRAVALRL